MPSIVLILLLLWLVVVAFFVFKKNNNIIVLAKKKITDNSPFRRGVGLTDDAREIDNIIDSGRMAIMIKYPKDEEINPELLHDLIEDMQEVIFRKDRTILKNRVEETPPQKELINPSNNYLNVKQLK